MSAPRLAALAALAALALCALGIAAHAAAAPPPPAGPPATFERRGATVCATYVHDASFNLYRDRISASQGSTRLPLSGLPPGVAKSIAGFPETVMDAGFRACATAPLAGAEILWADQSCMSAQGVCLPPRAYSIAANGTAVPLDGARAAAIFADSRLSAGAKPSAPGDGWAFSFKPK